MAKNFQKFFLKWPIQSGVKKVLLSKFLSPKTTGYKVEVVIDTLLVPACMDGQEFSKSFSNLNGIVGLCGNCTGLGIYNAATRNNSIKLIPAGCSIYF